MYAQNYQSWRLQILYTVPLQPFPGRSKIFQKWWPRSCDLQEFWRTLAVNLMAKITLRSTIIAVFRVIRALLCYFIERHCTCRHRVRYNIICICNNVNAYPIFISLGVKFQVAYMVSEMYNKETPVMKHNNIVLLTELADCSAGQSRIL